ncbi:MAG: Fe-S-containing protein [Acidobacteriia bacterium]|nr:Fe-S-containing protein [Terriglobia bacterium]
MLQAFIITLREGVEAALIVGITLAYLTKIGRNDLRKSVYSALAAAFAGSIAIAVLLSRLNWNQDIFEGWVMLVASVFVVTMIIFMMKTGRKLKGEIEGKIGLFARDDAWIGLFLFVFLMVLREGVETVLILSAVKLNSTELMSFIGTSVGVVVAILFGVMFVKGSVKINLQKFFKVTTAILFFVAAQLLIGGLHELSENGVLPSSREEMAIIGPIVRNELFFLVTILVLAALMVLFEMKSRQPIELPSAGAARRKALWTAGRERLWMASVYVCSFLFIVMITASFIYEKSASALSPATEVTFVNGAVSIPVKQVYDGDLHRFAAKEGGVEIRFWLYQKPDGKIATLFDACEICGPVGFYKGMQGVICKNCAAPINPQSVGMAGGCNPIPLKAQVTDDAVIVSEADIVAGRHYFEQK